jgi:hypothetical protein
MGGEARFAAVLLLSALGVHEGRVIFSARLGDVTEHVLRVLGADVFPSEQAARAVFEGREAYFGASPDGRVDAFYFAPQDPPAFEHAMQALLEQMQVSLPSDGASSWSVAERNAIGASTARYQVERADPLTLSRSRGPYDAIRAASGDRCIGCLQDRSDRATIVLDGDGILKTLQEAERVSLTRPKTQEPVFASWMSFQAKWMRTDTFEPPTQVSLDLAHLRVRRPGEVVASPGADADLLAQRAGGMNREAVLMGLRIYGKTGKLLDPTFVGRAAALLLQHPELCEELLKAFQDASLGPRGQALAMDVLASAATSPAQAAMRKALSTPEVKRDPAAYVALLQRFTVVGHPDAESVRFVRDAWESAAARGDRQTRSGAALTLGALTRALARNGDAALAAATDARLRSELGRATSAADKAAYLTALGNAAQPGDAEAIVPLAKDDDPRVRASAANALRNETTVEARAALVALAGDSHADVQQAALAALDARPLAAEDMKSLGSVLASGAIASSNDGPLVTFVSKHAQDAPDVARQMLQYVLEQAQQSGDRPLEARVKILLKRAEAGSD